MSPSPLAVVNEVFYGSGVEGVPAEVADPYSCNPNPVSSWCSGFDGICAFELSACLKSAV